MAQMPAAIATPEEALVITLHAEGGQLYECKAGSDRKLAWTLREPTATLRLKGKTVGRHYAGPNWEHTDGSAVGAKVVAMLAGVTTVLQINTQGGVHSGPCDKAGSLYSAPYSADYVSLQKGG